MVSRRVVVGGGVAVVAAGAGLHVAGRDDDVLRALGARPRPMPDPADTRLLERAAADQAALAASVGRLEGVRTDDLVTVLRTQLDGLGGAADVDASPSTRSSDVATVVADLNRTASRRQTDALAAVSPDLARVLASLAAGQAQVARTLGRRAGGA
ncbi:hypothetical protein [Aeromicrobium sp. CnD17-E]|uniref:hypothetical protein n=1 Tax=Aeromicrobium sp. CnD17-E TaxID=2954487 RepID=UPI0020981F8F|nr:hypothetical protein [Aeromicrobium sp. CnD17-E]MCO7239504.1 hypothetical protein [Aeromicrobium sp. CnD17-E]